MNKIINTFSLLKKEVKRQKLLNMLEVLEWWDNIFTDIFQLMKELKEDISEDFMVSIYIILIEAMQNLSNENIWEYVGKLEDIKNKFLEFKKQEEIEKKQEENENENILTEL